MKDGRFSTIRFNEWICISAQYEKAIARIGKQVYQGYSKGLVTDFTSIELCRDIAETFREAKELREEMEEELERDALDGLNQEEAAKADEVRELTQAQRTKRAMKLKLTMFMGRQSINRTLATHRNKVKELSRDLGQRALICFPEEPVLKVRGHKSLCRLANKLQEDADTKWEEITASKGKGGGLSFHTILFGFIGDFARFSKGTHLGRMILKYFKYDESEENKKLTQQYAGTQTAEALQAQMAEIDEPMLDVGREIDNMQQEYEGSLDEWNTSPSDDGFEDGQVTEESYDFSADAEVEWTPDADAWNPDDSVDNDFLDAVADVPDVGSPSTTPAPPTPASPKLLRKRPEPEAESWMSEPTPEPEAWLSEPDPEPENWMADGPSVPEPAAPEPPPAFTPKITSEPAAEAPADSSSDPDDWGWGSEDSTSEPEPSLSSPLGQTPAQNDPQPLASPVSEEPESTTEFRSKPTSKKPPFVKSKQADKPLAEVDGWGSATASDGWDTPSSDGWDTPASDGWDTPAADGWDTPAAPSAPPTPQAPKEEDYGWGTPAAAEPKAKPPEPTAPQKPAPEPPAPKPAAGPLHDIDPTLDTMTIDVKKLAERIRAESDPDDPLLKLLDTQGGSGIEKPGDSGDLGDDLLPDFLRDRTEDEPSADDTFIPELPSFLESEDAPNLEIVPFGSTPDAKEDEDDDPFIPQMPE